MSDTASAKVSPGLLYIYIYIHTHTHIYIYIYIYICIHIGSGSTLVLRLTWRRLNTRPAEGGNGSPESRNTTAYVFQRNCNPGHGEPDTADSMNYSMHCESPRFPDPYTLNPNL